jgi:hypothetical protein
MHPAAAARHATPATVRRDTTGKQPDKERVLLPCKNGRACKECRHLTCKISTPLAPEAETAILKGFSLSPSLSLSYACLCFQRPASLTTGLATSVLRHGSGPTPFISLGAWQAGHQHMPAPKMLQPKKVAGVAAWS